MKHKSSLLISSSRNVSHPRPGVGASSLVGHAVFREYQSTLIRKNFQVCTVNTLTNFVQTPVIRQDGPRAAELMLVHRAQIIERYCPHSYLPARGDCTGALLRNGAGHVEDDGRFGPLEGFRLLARAKQFNQVPWMVKSLIFS